jgi:hypothetical protein
LAPGQPLTETSLPGLAQSGATGPGLGSARCCGWVPLCLVSPADPLYDEGHRELWWRALDALATAEQTVAVFSLPPASALSTSQRLHDHRRLVSARSGGDRMKTRSPLSLWIIAGLLTPLVIVGGLLGALSSGENALERVPVALVNNDELIT